MKTAIKAFVLLLCFASSAAYAAPETDVVATKRILEQEQQAIDVASAVIRSRHELNQFLTANHASPLHAMSSSAREQFFDSLVFTDRGLGSYSYEPLVSSLSVTEIHRILSLFGVQSSMEAIPGLHASNGAERLMLRAMERHARPNSQCYMGEKKTYCRATRGSICPSSCEPF